MPQQLHGDDGDAVEKILIVEDDDSVAELHEHTLSQDYETEIASNGAEAIAKFDSDTDVVVLDRRLPGMSGDEVLKALSEQGTRFGVIIASAIDPGKTIIEHPFDSYLTKTVDPEDLKEEIEYVKRKNELMEVFAEYLETAETFETLEARTPTSDGEIEMSLSRIQHELEELESEVKTLVEELDNTRLSHIFEAVANAHDKK